MQKEIENILISEINIANPRSRNRQKWQEIVASIRDVGLKKPITVTRRESVNAESKYDLVCGQGRIEAFVALGETAIPAIVIDATREDRFLMSLVENVARRPPSNRDILREVKLLRSRGYGVNVISEKIGHDRSYVFGLVHLIEHSEESLIQHVEAGRLPISVAVEIASGSDQTVSAAMSEAYQSGELRGAKLKAVRRLLAARAAKQKAEGKTTHQARVTGNSLVAVYQQTLKEQKSLIQKAEQAKERLVILTSAFKLLISDENFLTLLRAEQLFEMPEKLAQRMH